MLRFVVQYKFKYYLLDLYCNKDPLNTYSNTKRPLERSVRTPLEHKQSKINAKTHEHETIQFKVPIFVSRYWLTTVCRFFFAYKLTLQVTFEHSPLAPAHSRGKRRSSPVKLACLCSWRRLESWIYLQV